MRIASNRIVTLQPNEIFVFGSNLEGQHAGGAAYLAYKRFGAIWGQGVGLQGQSYAIPTMQGGVETIKPYVDEFIEFAEQHPSKTFLVTEIGCGIAGFTVGEIAVRASERGGEYLSAPKILGSIERIIRAVDRLFKGDQGKPL